jgi:hypothetical protein
MLHRENRAAYNEAKSEFVGGVINQARFVSSPTGD